MDQDKDNITKDFNPEAMLKEIERQEKDLIMELVDHDRIEMLKEMAETQRQWWELIKSIQENAEHGSIPYLMHLWDRVLGDDENDAIQARWEIAHLYCTRGKVFPVTEERSYMLSLFRDRLDLYNEELRDNPKSETELWHEQTTLPEFEIILKDPKTNIPITCLADQLRYMLRKAIKQDLLNTTKPFAKRDTHLTYDIDQYDHQFTPARDLIAGKLEALGYDTNPMGNDLLALTSLEVNKLTEHEVELLVRFERGELEQYARECGKSVSALYKQRERLRNRIQKNVQNEINKLDAI